ncbi:MAG TPA: GGDEF domain-containing protein [Methylococcaceae bacterium]|nr:GGDEF domain-containing protein [Methylococcaceae bacterium]
MKHFSAIVDSVEQAAEFLGGKAVQDAAASARSALVQVFVGHRDEMWIGRVVEAIGPVLPHAVIVGISSAGEIADGRVSVESTVVSASFFHSASLHPFALASTPGDEHAAGKAIAEAFRAIPDLKGILLLAPATRVDCAAVLRGIESGLPDTPVFGGGAAETLASKQPRVFLDTRLFERGCVAVALAGAGLHLETHVFLGWKALGPKMTLTDVANFDICSIDGHPALDAYRKYLGITPGDEDIYLIEFPLLIERHGALIARNPVSSGKEGCVTLVADIYQGETARLGYLDVDSVMQNARDTRAMLERQSPEAIYLYSCICRRFTLQQDVELETRPFQSLAPVAGFFTSGEFCRSGDHLQLLNSTQVVVALREGDAKAVPAQQEAGSATATDRYRFRHARITSHLFHFISALSEEVEEANRRLLYLAEHDALTGALNRRVLDATLDAEVSRAARYGRPLSFAMFDLDHFKRFNDDYGHPAGDHVLQSVADAVRHTIRDSDTLYRYGGEEFLLLLPETAMSGALGMAEKVREAIGRLSLHVAGQALPAVSTSFGVACYPHHGNSGLVVLNAADAALYRAKESGRNRVCPAADVP